jgi:hypothetical protein
MEKRTAGLVGALAGLATMGVAHAAIKPEPVMQVVSYSDLLKPIPNAEELLKASNAELQARVQQAQYYNEPPDYHHHHHHHHNAYYPPPPPPDYHHHHHHHGGVTIVVPGVGAIHTN